MTEEIYQKGTEGKAPGLGGRATKDLYCLYDCKMGCFAVVCAVFSGTTFVYLRTLRKKWQENASTGEWYSSCEGTRECITNMYQIILFCFFMHSNFRHYFHIFEEVPSP